MAVIVASLDEPLPERGRATAGAGHVIAVRNLLNDITMLLISGACMVADQAGARVRGTLRDPGNLFPRPSPCFRNVSGNAPETG